MERHINTYQGMNKDTAYDSIPPNLYIDAKDIRITTTNGESIGAFTNIQGNEQIFNIPTSSTVGSPFHPWLAFNPEIIGYTTIRNKIILFVADTSDNKGWIYEVIYDETTRNILAGYPLLKYYNPNFNFKKEFPIEALGRFESSCIERVYFTDYNNYFRVINLGDPNLSTFPIGLLDIFPDVTFTQPRLKTVAGGGVLFSGEYQAAFRLITSDGKETLISPPSNMIHVTSNSETTESARYNGDSTNVNTGKSLTIEIDTTDYSDFEKIELIIIYHSNLNNVPQVTTVETVGINNQTSIEFLYTGTEGTIFPIELLTFTSRNNPFKTVKTITQKDNSLVIANIKNSNVKLSDLLGPGETFSALTKRYDILSTPVTPTLNDAFNKEYNKDAHWDNNWHANEQFKYQANGSTLGGQGPNISYKFHLEPFSLNVDITPGFATISNTPFGFGYDVHDLNDGYGAHYNTTYPNHASPFISGLLRGYKRGETYRFGIVFYNIKGEASFVEYIGDIKFPDISEKDGANNDSGTPYFPLSRVLSSNISVGYALGIEFSLDFSTCPILLSNITSYQIVRVKREEVDTRRASQGVIKTFWFAPVASGSLGFDLQINGNNQSLHLMPYYPSLGMSSENATFNTLEDQEGNPSPFTPVVSDYLIKGNYLSLMTPDISFNYNNVRTRSTNLNNTPSLLLTGAYGSYTRQISGSAGQDLTAQGLGESCQDWRNTCRATLPVKFNNNNNIKTWEDNKLITIEDTSDYKEKVTGVLGSGVYAVRNYYAIDDYTDATAHLNDPQGSSVITNIPEFNKGGTAIVGKIKEITFDPLTNIPITSLTGKDYFDAPDNIQVLNPITGAPTPIAHPTTTPIIDLLFPKSEVYGGYNQNALEVNRFIPASPVIKKGNINPRVFGGDIFVNMFTLQTAMTEFDTVFYGNNKYWKDNTRTEVYPVESVINLELANGATIRTRVEYTFSGLQLPIFRQENNNTLAPDAKTFDMYNYFSVYSAENDDVTFFIEPQGSGNNCNDVNDIRTYLSNVKINGELIDSWTQFGVNNYYDVDDYGPINKILNWKDTVFFIQDKAVGTYAINRSAITTTTDGIPTELGTGKGFSSGQYISKEHGAIHQYGVKATDSGIYLFDAIHKKFFLLRDSMSPLSEIQGIHSFVQLLPPSIFLRKENEGDNPILGKGIAIGKDTINDEVIFTFLSINEIIPFTLSTAYTIGQIVLSPLGDYRKIINNFSTTTNPAESLSLFININSISATNTEVFNSISLVYDELAQKFSSRYSPTPKTWIDNGNILISPNPLNPKVSYTHNKGNWGEFYGIVEESFIKLVINPNADINKILRTLEFNSIVRDNNKVVDRTVTITAFRIETESQDTGKILFSSNRIKRRFDKWRVKLSRDINSTNQRSRLRSTHFIVTLYFDNTENKEFIMNRLISYYDVQIF